MSKWDRLVKLIKSPVISFQFIILVKMVDQPRTSPSSYMYTRQDVLLLGIHIRGEV